MPSESSSPNTTTTPPYYSSRKPYETLLYAALDDTPPNHTCDKIRAVEAKKDQVEEEEPVLVEGEDEVHPGAHFQELVDVLERSRAR